MGSNPECFFEYFSSSNTGLIPHWSLGWWRSVGRLVGWLIELVIIGLVGIFRAGKPEKEINIIHTQMKAMFPVKCHKNSRIAL